MVESLIKWIKADAPSGWDEVLARTVKVAVVAFVVLQMKEWFDAGMFDTPAAALDAALVAAGTFVLSLVLPWAKR